MVILLSLGAHLIDIVLNNSSPNHRSGTGKEASSDPLDRSELYADPAEARVKEEVEDRYENYQRKWVKIVDYIVWNAIGHHGGGLGCQVVDHLIICKPYSKRYRVNCDFDVERTIQGIPGEHGACLEATANLLHPFVVESHPLGSLAVRDVAWFSRLPKVVGLEVPVESDGVW